MIRQSYTPLTRNTEDKPRSNRLSKFLEDVAAARLSKEELLTCYASLVRSHSSSDQATAEQLGVVRRTANQWIDRQLADQFRAENGD